MRYPASEKLEIIRPADRLDRFLSAAVGMVFLCSHRCLLSDDAELNLLFKGPIVSN